MIRLTDSLITGNSDDAYSFVKLGVGGVLNVAHDLRGFKECNHPDVEYMQVGLIDGPGNEMVGYYSAIMSLVALARRHELVAVYDHDGGMALAVCLMYLNLTEGQFRADPLQWSHWLTWEERFLLTSERVGRLVRPPHRAHIEAFGKVAYGILEALL